MTCALLTPWWHSRPADAHRSARGGVEPTATLDWRSRPIQSLLDELAGEGDRELLLVAHGLIATRVRPVYALDDAQPTSRTLTLGRGSCSQRLAVLEAVARGAGIATRVRGLLVDGRFWYPRFPHLRCVMPDTVLLAWPEFRLGETWVSASGLFGPVGSASDGTGFTNAGGETLFEAVARTAVDWDGECASCDLSAMVVRDLGRFDSRDELFALHGQTLCRLARTLAGPILGRWSAGATRAAA